MFPRLTLGRSSSSFVEKSLSGLVEGIITATQSSWITHMKNARDALALLAQQTREWVAIGLPGAGFIDSGFAS